MHDDATRVVLDNLPYLLVRRRTGHVAAYGPFVPGTEPALAECTTDREVHDRRVVTRLQELAGASPAIPPHSDNLAGRE
jgi:hypothetical protein